MDGVDMVVIGAGVVGLAVARALALSSKFAGKELLVLEAANANANANAIRTGTGTSLRNSEVIHAGIYYPQDIIAKAAGLSVPAVANSMQGLDAKFVPQAYFAKGN